MDSADLMSGGKGRNMLQRLTKHVSTKCKYPEYLFQLQLDESDDEEDFSMKERKEKKFTEFKSFSEEFYPTNNEGVISGLKIDSKPEVAQEFLAGHEFNFNATSDTKRFASTATEADDQSMIATEADDQSMIATEVNDQSTKATGTDEPRATTPFKIEAEKSKGNFRDMADALESPLTAPTTSESSIRKKMASALKRIFHLTNEEKSTELKSTKDEGKSANDVNKVDLDTSDDVVETSNVEIIKTAEVAIQTPEKKKTVTGLLPLEVESTLGPVKTKVPKKGGKTTEELVPAAGDVIHLGHPDAKERISSMKVGEYRLIKTSDGEEAAIAMRNSGEAIVLIENAKLKNSDTFADEILPHALLAASNKPKWNDVKKCYIASSATKMANKYDLETSANRFLTLNPPPYLRKWTATKLECKCGRPCLPQLEAAAENIVKCIGECNNFYHKSCINDVKCAPCQLSNSGVLWGAGYYTNTCPVDNFLTVSALHAEKNPQWVSEHFTDANATEADTVLVQTLNMIQQNRVIEAQNHYCSFLNTKGIGVKPYIGITETGEYEGRKGCMFGIPEDLTTHLFDSSKLVYTEKCKHSNCRSGFKDIFSTHEITSVQLFAYTHNGTRDIPVKDINESIQDALHAKTESCTFCKADYNSVRDRTPVDFKNPHQPAPWINFNTETLSSCIPTKELVSGLPEKVHIGSSNQSYSRAMSILHSAAKGHFTCLFDHKNDKLYYDGMNGEQNNVKTIKYAIPEHCEDNNRTLNSVLYFHDCHISSKM